MNKILESIVPRTADIMEITDYLMSNDELWEKVTAFAKVPADPLFSENGNNVRIHFDKKGDTIYLLGNYREKDADNSSHLEILYDAIGENMVTSAHSLKDKGLFIALIEACSVNRLGFDITADSELDEKEFLFGTGNNAILISVCGEKEEKFIDYIYNNVLDITLLGHVTKGELRMDEISFGFINDFLS
jgi:hypothetical protein